MNLENLDSTLPWIRRRPSEEVAKRRCMFSQMLFRRSDDHPGLMERRFLRLTLSATILIRFASSRRRDRASGGRWIEKEGVGRNGTTWRFELRSTPCSVVAAQDILRDDRRLRDRSGPDRSARPARVVAGATGASASGSPFMFSPSSVAPHASSASSTPCAGRPPRRRHHDRPLRNRNVHYRQRYRCVCRPAKRYRNRSRQPIWPFVAPGSDHPATNRGGTCLGDRFGSPQPHGRPVKWGMSAKDVDLG